MKFLWKTLMKIMALLMNKLTPSCDVISYKISKSVDENISLKDKLSIKFHIIFCKFCRRYEQQIKLLHNMFHDNFEQYSDSMKQSSPQLSEESRLKIKKMLSDDKKD